MCVGVGRVSCYVSHCVGGCVAGCLAVIIIVIEMSIIKVALSHFCCRTTVQSDSVSVARQVTVPRW